MSATELALLLVGAAAAGCAAAPAGAVMQGGDLTCVAAAVATIVNAVEGEPYLDEAEALALLPGRERLPTLEDAACALERLLRRPVARLKTMPKWAAAHLRRRGRERVLLVVVLPPGAFRCHAVVVLGVRDDDEALVFDPAKGLYGLEFSRLGAWAGRAAPDGRPVVFLEVQP